MTQEHSITPPSELVQQWITEGHHQDYCNTTVYCIAQAAQWGADHELEACCEWLAKEFPREKAVVHALRTARRPKPPSLKEQALIEQFAESAKGTFLAEDRTSNFPSENTILNRAQEAAARVMAQREEIISAFIAKHGFEPDAAVQVERRQADGTTVWSIEHRDASRLNSVDSDWDVDRGLTLAQSKPRKPTDAQLAETAREVLESYSLPSALPYFLFEDSVEHEPLMLILRGVLDRWSGVQ